MNVDSLVQLGRRLIADTLLDAGTIYVHTVVTDNSGGWTDVWTARQGIQACRLVTPKDQPLTNIGDVLSGPAVVILELPIDVAFDDSDRILVNGILYQAVGKISAESVTAVVQRIVVREV